MKVPLNWLRDYVDLTLPVAAARRAADAGRAGGGRRRACSACRSRGLRVKAEDVGPVWDRDKIVIGQVLKRREASQRRPAQAADRRLRGRPSRSSSSPARRTSRSATAGRRSSSPWPAPYCSTAMSDDKEARRAEADARFAACRRCDGLLRLRTGHLRRARRHHPPGRRRPGRHAARRLHGRHRPRNRRAAEHGPLPVDDRRGPRSGRAHRPAAEAPAAAVAGRRRADRGPGESADRRSEALGPLRRRADPRRQDRPGARLDAAPARSTPACGRSTTSWTSPITSCSNGASRCTPSITTCWCSAPAARRRPSSSGPPRPAKCSSPSTAANAS